MNYRHAFHAGNFADVFKHALLSRIFVYMKRKDAALRFIDTHAGIGWYDLAADEARRTGEWREGIGRLAGAAMPPDVSELLGPYLTAVGLSAGEAAPARYPGSPALAAAMLRPQDRMIFCELHPVDAAVLASVMRRDRRVKTVEIDGYTALRAYVPPVERRGIVLIDPPFEKTDEFTTAARNIAEAWHKWPAGAYCLWYPLKPGGGADGFFAALVEAGVRKILRMDLAVREPEPGAGLCATGLAVVNPPYVLEREARTLLPWLAATLGQGPGATWSVDWIAGEDE
ncbi:MAG: 23S rRNA (adenine(2030)-N(6))-methyltransferase RlmJ [Beijerinckiaceae bacterium]